MATEHVGLDFAELLITENFMVSSHMHHFPGMPDTGQAAMQSTNFLAKKSSARGHPRRDLQDFGVATAGPRGR
jgi:hypothetical protein